MYRKELPDSDSGEMEYREFKMIFDSSERKYEFMIAEKERFSSCSKESTETGSTYLLNIFHEVVGYG